MSEEQEGKIRLECNYSGMPYRVIVELPQDASMKDLMGAYRAFAIACGYDVKTVFNHLGDD